MRFTLLILALNVRFLFATHIVGGDMTYAALGGDSFRITLRLYIDCYNGEALAIAQDRYAILAVYTGDSGNQLTNLCGEVERNTPVRVSKTNYNCIKIAPNACVDAYDYVTTMHLPPRPGGYIISFQRCCRNNTIVNLVNPYSTGENIWTHIPDTTGIGTNSSPVFRNLPPNFLCTNAPLVFDHSATDADGDSLIYEFFHPYTGATYNLPRPGCTRFEKPPFSQVTFASPYTPYNAMPSLPAISLNRLTGLLEMTPTMQGQFVVGIMVKEYRNGVLIGITRRDYQFNVQNCVFETTSAFVTPSVNCNREVFFTNNSQNADAYKWDFGDSTTNGDTSILKNGYYRYPGPGTFRVKLIASNGNCADTLSKNVMVYDNILFKLPSDTLLCPGQGVTLRPDSLYTGATYLWNTGSTDSLITVKSPGKYVLTITYGLCSNTDSTVILDDQEIVYLSSDSMYCDLAVNQLHGQLYVKGDFRTISWKSDPDIMPEQFNDSQFNINEPGTFMVFGIKNNGCPYADTLIMMAPDAGTIFRLPNVFTPNGDLINDVFPEPTPSYLYHLTVFNRWGIRVHDRENKVWNGQDFPDGTYYYFIRMEACEEKRNAHGVIKIIR